MESPESERRHQQQPTEWTIGGRLFIVRDPEAVFDSADYESTKHLLEISFLEGSAVSRIGIKSHYSRVDAIKRQFVVSCNLELDGRVVDIDGFQSEIANPIWSPPKSSGLEIVRRVPTSAENKYVLELSDSRQLLLEFVKVRHQLRVRITNDLSQIRKNAEDGHATPIESWNMDPRSELVDTLTAVSAIMDMVTETPGRLLQARSSLGAEQLQEWCLNPTEDDLKHYTLMPLIVENAPPSISVKAFLNWMQAVLPEKPQNSPDVIESAVDQIVSGQQESDALNFPDFEARRKIICSLLAAMSIDYWVGKRQFYPVLDSQGGFLDRLSAETHNLVTQEVVKALVSAVPGTSAHYDRLLLTDILHSIEKVRKEANGS